MKKKQVLRILPELYMLAAVLFCWISFTFYNAIAFVLFAVIGYQLYTQKAVSGILISGIFILLNLYMSLALVSELGEFNEFTSSFYELLIVGSLYLGVNLFVSCMMILKYIKNNMLSPVENKIM